MPEKDRPFEQMLELNDDEALSAEHLDWQEQIRSARESFAQHLELIESIDPRSWNPSDLHKELSRALSTVDDARTEYNEHRSRLQAAGAEGEASLPDTAPGVYENSDRRSFSEWL